MFHSIHSVWTLTIDDASLALQTVVTPPPPPPPAPLDPNNLILNPWFETANGLLPMNWSKGWWGTNASTMTYPIAWYNSTNAAKITVTSYTDWDAKWFFDDVAVSPLNSYTFSDMYNSTVDTNITARFKLTNGTYTYAYLWTAPKTTWWQNYTSTIWIPQWVVWMTIFHSISSVWTLTIDDAKISVAQKDQFTQWMVSFVFDDWFKSVYNKAIPILDAAGIKSTQAILPGSFTYPEYMTAAQVKTLYDKWHEIASHTINHVHLTQITLASATQEITQSKAMLSAIWVNTNTFVYPYGEYNSSTIDILKTAWYIWARSVEEWINTPSSDKFQLKDLHIESTTTWATIKAWIDTAIADKKWIILEMHAQGTNLWQYANDPALLQTIVNYVKAQGIKTVTLGQWIWLMK
jgi:peptidoglycan/xylan/chitin deacetylase (PgdA/CDA1 family)